MDLIQALSQQLQRMTGVSVPADAWRPELLPDHLFACFDVCDGQGNKLDTGRDLQQLQARFGDHAQKDFSRLADTGFEKKNIQDWDFGDLPEFLELDRGGVTVRGYPGLAVVDGTIELRMFDQQRQAHASHKEGLLALFRLRTGRLIKEIRRAVPELQKQALWFSTIASAEVLQADLEQAVLQAAFMGEEPDVRNGPAFHQKLVKGKSRLVELSASIGRWSFEALQNYHELDRLLKASVSPQLLEATGEVRDQVQQLIFPGFLSATPLRWLPHLGRYLRAAIQRLDKLSGNIERDRRQSALVRRHWQRYEQAAAGKLTDEALTGYRWLIEELRVSLFAQELGTSEKVSPERLDRLWDKISS
jgi:ATP-dependent helicase HrpA